MFNLNNFLNTATNEHLNTLSSITLPMPFCFFVVKKAVYHQLVSCFIAENTFFFLLVTIVDVLVLIGIMQEMTGITQVVTRVIKVMTGISKVVTGTRKVMTRVIKVVTGATKVMTVISKVVTGTTKVMTRAIKVMTGITQVMTGTMQITTRYRFIPSFQSTMNI